MPCPGFDSEIDRKSEGDSFPMRNRPKRLAHLAFILALFAVHQSPVGAPAILHAQSSGEGTANAPRPNAEICTQCYLQLQKDNRNCESLKGQDWQICREAASSAYRQCSRGC